MADYVHELILRQGVNRWNTFRRENWYLIPDLSRLNLHSAELSGANLHETKLILAKLPKANLTGANLSRAKLSRADLRQANLSGADLSGARIRMANLSQANLSATNLSWADLNLVNLTNANLTGANLTGTNLHGVKLINANLSGTDLRGRDMSGWDLSGCDLHGCDFKETKLCKAKLNGTKLDGAKFRRAMLRKASLTDASLIGADFREADLEGADLSKSDLSGAWLIEANLTQANLNGAILEKCTFIDAEGHSAIVTEAKLPNVVLTSPDKSTHEGSFLDLAAAVGLETVDFGDSAFLQQYLSDAFAFACRPDLRERKELPEFVDTVIKRIKCLRKLYADQIEPPAYLIDVVKVITAELIKYLAKHPRELYKLRPRQFEELIAEILSSYGWQVDLTPPTKDGGYDLFAISKDETASVRTSWIIECKKYGPKHKVGVDVVRALFGVKADLKVANALLATTSYFTQGVKNYKASRYDLELKDYRDILNWINTYRPNPNGQLYIKDNQLILPE